MLQGIMKDRMNSLSNPVYTDLSRPESQRSPGPNWNLCRPLGSELKLPEDPRKSRIPDSEVVRARMVFLGDERHYL